MWQLNTRLDSGTLNGCIDCSKIQSSGNAALTCDSLCYLPDDISSAIAGLGTNKNTTLTFWVDLLKFIYNLFG